MRNLLKKEIYKLIHNYFFGMCVLGDVLFAFLSAPSYISDVKKGRDITALFDAMVYDSTVWIIVFSIVVIYFMGKDFSSRTINNDLYSGHARRRVLISKGIVFLCVFNILLLIFPIVGTIRMFPQMEMNSGVFAVFHFLRVIAFSIILNSAIFSMCLFIIIVFRDIALSISVSTFILLLSALIVAYGKPLGWFSRFKFLNLIPMQQIRDILSDRLEPGSLITILLSGVLFFCFFSLLAVLKFEHCELK